MAVLLDIPSRIRLLDWLVDPSTLSAGEAVGLLAELDIPVSRFLLSRLDLNKAPAALMAGVARRVSDSTFSERVLERVETGGSKTPPPLFTAASSLLLMQPTEENLADWAEMLAQDRNSAIWQITLAGLELLHPEWPRPPLFEMSSDTELMLLKAISPIRRANQLARTDLYRAARLWRLQGASAEHHKQWTRILGGANTKIPHTFLFSLLGCGGIQDLQVTSPREAQVIPYHIPSWSYFKWTVEHWGRHGELTGETIRRIPPVQMVAAAHPQFASEYERMVDVMTVLNK